MMKRRGFTLIELLIVLVVIGVLSSITVVVYDRCVNSAKLAEAIENMGSIAFRQKVHFQEHGEYFEAYSEEEFQEVGMDLEFTNFAYSTRARGAGFVVRAVATVSFGSGAGDGFEFADGAWVAGEDNCAIYQNMLPEGG